MKKTILFLLNNECTYLPPFMSILDSLYDQYALKVISYEKEGGKKYLTELYKGKDIEFLSTKTQDTNLSIPSKIKRRVAKKLNVTSAFYKEAVDLFNLTKYDLLWVIHEETMFEFKRELIGRKYIASFYELYDHRRNFLQEIEPVVQGALEVLVPEYNRACILRVWLQLEKTPTVVHNKPLGHPLKRNIENQYSEIFKDKKIVLYQGYITRSRNVDKICEACEGLKDYTFVMMGGGDKTYIEELKSKYPSLIHIGFVRPPEHLYITSYARMGIVKYDFVLLNAIYCAPNKTWEYTGFGIPVLAHNIPGLEYTIGKYKAGVCTDMDDIECIKNAILEIDSNYETYSKNAIDYYNSYDVKQSINEIVNRNI